MIFEKRILLIDIEYLAMAISSGNIYKNIHFTWRLNEYLKNKEISTFTNSEKLRLLSRYIK